MMEANNNNSYICVIEYSMTNFFKQIFPLIGYVRDKKRNA